MRMLRVLIFSLRLNTWFGSTMVEERSDGLALLRILQDIEFVVENIISGFAKPKESNTLLLQFTNN